MYRNRTQIVFTFLLSLGVFATTFVVAKEGTPTNLLSTEVCDYRLAFSSSENDSYQFSDVFSAGDVLQERVDGDLIKTITFNLSPKDVLRIANYNGFLKGFMTYENYLNQVASGTPLTTTKIFFVVTHLPQPFAAFNYEWINGDGKLVNHVEMLDMTKFSLKEICY